MSIAEKSRVSERRVDFGRSDIISRTPWWELRFDRRSIAVTLTFIVLSFVMLVLSLASGSYEIPVPQVIATLLGQGDAADQTVILEWRLPRAMLAILLGAALALSGGIFQSISRNPLGSPDIIGFSSGSYTGALLVMLAFGGGYMQVATGALLGGIATAFVVFVLAYRGGVQGFRLIIVGIGVSAMLSAFNTWLVLKASIEEALRAGVWGSGSLNGLSTDQLWPVLGILVVLVPIAIAFGPALRQLELGDDAAAALGTRTTRVRLITVVIGVAFTALVTATAGPIAFISLCAPQIARRLTRTSGIGLIPTAAVGAFLLITADFIGQRLFAPMQLPVGIVTVSIGGIYFVWLLVREGRRQ